MTCLCARTSIDHHLLGRRLDQSSTPMRQFFFKSFGLQSVKQQKIGWKNSNYTPLAPKHFQTVKPKSFNLNP
jgi:hypothetical protein